MATLKQQPQVAQLILTFGAPLVKDSIVENLSDLITIPTISSYQHKMVWVKSEKSFYYIINGNGSVLNNWEKYTSKLTIELWSNSEQYAVGDIVYIGTKIFKAINPVLVGEDPLSSNNWLCIAGELESYTYYFENLSNVIVYINIPNPQITITLGELIRDVNNDPVLNIFGFPQVEDGEIIETLIKLRTDLPYNNGYPYEIIFTEDSLPVQQTGLITYK